MINIQSVTIDLTDGAGNGTTSFSKTVGGITVTFFNPEGGAFYHNSLGICVGTGGLNAYFSMKFSQSVELNKYEIGSGMNQGFPFALTGTGLNSSGNSSQSGIHTFVGGPLTLSANTTYTLTTNLSSAAYMALKNLVINESLVTVPAISATNANFGNVLVMSSKNENITITNTGASGSTLTGSIGEVPSGSEFNAQSSTAINSLTSGSSQNRSFTYSPTNRGTDTRNVTITSNDPNNPTITRTLSGTGVAPVNQVTQTNLPTYTRTGTTNTASVTVKNIGNGNLADASLGSARNLNGTVLAPTGSPEFSGNGTNLSLTDGSQQTLNYNYSPTARGEDTANIQINFSNGNTNETNTAQTVIAQLSSTAVSPVYVSSIAPDSTIDFGVVEAFSTSQYTLRIQNLTPDQDLGDLTKLTILNAIISGPDASYFAMNFSSSQIISKGGYYDLLLSITNPEWRFANRSATLTIVTDQDAAFGAEGRSFTYNLTALCVPEPSSLFMIIVMVLGIGIQNRKFFFSHN